MMTCHTTNIFSKSEAEGKRKLRRKCKTIFGKSNNPLNKQIVAKNEAMIQNTGTKGFMSRLYCMEGEKRYKIGT